MIYARVLRYTPHQLDELVGVLMNCHCTHLQFPEFFSLCIHGSFHEVMLAKCLSKLCPTHVGGVRVDSAKAFPPSASNPSELKGGNVHSFLVGAFDEFKPFDSM